MEAFTIEIAGLAARVHPLFETTQVYCRAYLTDKAPELMIEVTQQDLYRQQHLLDLEADAEGLRRRVFTGPFLERMTIQQRLAEALLQRDTLLLHGSTVGVDGQAYLFTAACGTGKSTHTRLWRQVFGQRAVMVNDDKPFLQLTEDAVLAHGSPFSGKHGLDSNICLPLKGICILHRGKENEIRPIKPEEALAMLRHQSFVPEDGALREKARVLVQALAERVPLWELSCNKAPQAAKVSYEAMSGGG